MVLVSAAEALLAVEAAVAAEVVVQTAEDVLYVFLEF